jgi:hypothetical protein
MSGPTDYFLIIGAVAVLMGTLLLWRMAVEVLRGNIGQKQDAFTGNAFQSVESESPPT